MITNNQTGSTLEAGLQNQSYIDEFRNSRGPPGFDFDFTNEVGKDLALLDSLPHHITLDTSDQSAVITLRWEIFQIYNQLTHLRGFEVNSTIQLLLLIDELTVVFGHSTAIGFGLQQTEI